MADTAAPLSCHALPSTKPCLSVASHAPGSRCCDSTTCACQARKALEPSVTGTVWRHPDFSSRLLGNERDLWVYLPPGYDPTSERRYPVLYLNDGNNMFSAATAFAGHEWGLDETAEWLIGTQQMSPIICVGIANTVERIAEYTWPSKASDESGRGPLYARFVIEEVKPFIDAVYRTQPHQAATGLMGSSLGGLNALYMGAYEGDVFGRIGAMSPSLWWDERRALSQLAQIRRDLRIWVDIGDREGDSPVEWAANREDARALAALLTRRGYHFGGNIYYYEAAGDGHDEGAWGRRAALALMFLYGPFTVTPEAGRS